MSNVKIQMPNVITLIPNEPNCFEFELCHLALIWNLSFDI